MTRAVIVSARYYLENAVSHKAPLHTALGPSPTPAHIYSKSLATYQYMMYALRANPWREHK